MRNLKKIGAVLTSAVMIAGLAACGGSSAPATTAAPAAAETTAAAADAAAPAAEALNFKMANQHSADTIANQLDQKMCDRIAEETEGRVNIQLYSDSALGDYTNVFDELMVGSIDVAHITGVETYDSRVSCTMIPYLAFDYDSLLKVYAPDGYLFGQLDEALSGVGIHLGGIFCEGFNGINCMKTLENMEEPGAEKGVIMRSPMLDVYSLTLQDMGFRVSSMPYSDTYTAMQTGVVDGLAGATAQVGYLSFRDLINSFYDYRYNQEATMIMFSQKSWDKISADDQATISAIVKDICDEAAVKAEEANNEYMDKLKEEGKEVYTFDAEVLNAYAESVRANVYPQLASNYPEGFMDGILDSLK